MDSGFADRTNTAAIMNKTNSNTAEISKYFIYFISICIIIVWTVLYMQGYEAIMIMKKGELADPDCYTRLNRVVQLYESGKWYDSVSMRSNAPFGETLHWTRPLDVLLFTGAWLASPLSDFKAGLFWWGVFISPFLLAASLVALPWAFRPILGHISNLISLLFFFQYGVIAFYIIGRPDHHSLLGFTFIITTGLILRVIMDSFNKTTCYVAGMMSAFSLWIHVESMLLIFVSILLLGFFWIFEDDDFVYKILHYSAALFLFTGAALILERPWYDLSRIEYDKISIVHWFIFGLISLFWVAVFSSQYRPVIPKQGRAGRFMISSLGAAVVALCIWFLFPDFYRGPYVDVDPMIVSIWLSKVNEVQSPLSHDFLMPLTQLLGSAITGISYIGFVLWKEPRKDVRGWIFILSGIVLFALAGIFERRLLLYGNIMTIVPLAAILDRVLRWEISHLTHITRKRTFILPLTIIVFGVAFLFIGYIFENIVMKDNVLRGEDRIVSLSQLCDELNELHTRQVHPTRILAFIDYGPEILYRTQHEVVGTPYHRNSRGILDTFKIMTAESDDEAHELVIKRKIDMILISDSPGERNFVSAPQKQSTFYERLRTKGPADWLRTVELPPHLSSFYRLFRVIG